MFETQFSVSSQQTVSGYSRPTSDRNADIVFETRSMKAIECESKPMSDWPLDQQIIKMKATS